MVAELRGVKISNPGNLRYLSWQTSAGLIEVQKVSGFNVGLRTRSN